MCYFYKKMSREIKEPWECLNLYLHPGNPDSINMQMKTPPTYVIGNILGPYMLGHAKELPVTCLILTQVF